MQIVYKLCANPGESRCVYNTVFTHILYTSLFPVFSSTVYMSPNVVFVGCDFLHDCLQTPKHLSAVHFVLSCSRGAAPAMHAH